METKTKRNEKLTLTVKGIDTMERRATPNTACPDGESTWCCRRTQARAERLTAVAFF